MDKAALARIITIRDEFPLMLRKGSIAVELGVAKGNFSETLLRHENIDKLFSIDAWSDRGHDEAEYSFTKNRLSKYGDRSSILRMTFHEAKDRFTDGFFDFVYIDGYAHEGEDGGRTISEWWPKVRVGGVLAGHDYCEHWPLVVKEVNQFGLDHELTINLTKESIHARTCTFPSWFVKKRQSYKEKKNGNR